MCFIGSFFCKYTNKFSISKKNTSSYKKGVTFFNINGINQHPQHQIYGIAQAAL